MVDDVYGLRITETIAGDDAATGASDLAGLAEQPPLAA